MKFKSFLNLFNAVPICGESNYINDNEKFLKKTIKEGFIFSKEVMSSYSEEELNLMIEEIILIVGLGAKKINSAFHKSWKIVRDSNMETLFLQQVFHYITTYGFESFGIYSESSIYIPVEKLNLPSLKAEKIPLVVIKGYTKEQFKEKVLNMLTSGIALHETTIRDLVSVAKFVGINEEDISKIKNKEVSAIFYDFLNIIPKNPTEFLRFCVYKITKKTLLIKDSQTINAIEDASYKSNIFNLFSSYSKQYGLEKLAEIFFRFKPLFLSFKSHPNMSATINKIRKLANSFHKPMSEDFLNNITRYIKNEKLDLLKLEEELKKVNIFRKVRLAYALKFRTSYPDSIMYKIRNGKTYITDFDKQPPDKYETPLKIILDSIASDLKEKLEGKKVFIPKEISYTIPATEKQFVGNFPCGTCVKLPDKMIFGVHWMDVERNRIDLDLSLIDEDGDKIGWDSSYRDIDDGEKILFSGDLTAAPKPNGASELFYVKANSNKTSILLVNYYNYYNKMNVPFKIIVSKVTGRPFSRKNLIIPNDVVSIDNTEIKTKQKILGLLVTNPIECKFYYIDTFMVGLITAIDSEFSTKARKYLFDFYSQSITLNQILPKAGVILVNSKDDCDINLSPEELEKDTIIKLLS